MHHDSLYHADNITWKIKSIILNKPRLADGFRVRDHNDLDNWSTGRQPQVVQSTETF